MQDKKSNLSNLMQEVQSAVCRRDGECPARQDEWKSSVVTGVHCDGICRDVIHPGSIRVLRVKIQ